jgi:fumarate reductase flavoprotein subunit
MSIIRPPYRIIPTVAGITYTMCGLEIDARCRVRTVEGATVDGLYAAGSSVGGLEGGEQTFYLGGLAKAAILGRVAGQNAARLAAGNGGRPPRPCSSSISRQA